MTKEQYEQKSLQYAEHYGVTEYTTASNKMIYYISYPQYLNNKRYTIKAVVNLDTMQEQRTQLKKYNRIGVYNRN